MNRYLDGTCTLSHHTFGSAFISKADTQIAYIYRVTLLRLYGSKNSCLILKNGRPASRTSSIATGRSVSNELSKSSVDYAERMEAQSWANQTEAEEPLGELENNMAKKDTMIPTPSTVSTDTIAHKVTTFPTANTNSIPTIAHEANLTHSPQQFHLVWVLRPTYGTATLYLFPYLE